MNKLYLLSWYYIHHGQNSFQIFHFYFPYVRLEVSPLLLIFLFLTGKLWLFISHSSKKHSTLLAVFLFVVKKQGYQPYLLSSIISSVSWIFSCISIGAPTSLTSSNIGFLILILSTRFDKSLKYLTSSL